jgi:hypothetical protein
VALSTREKYIALGVGATILLAGLYELVIDPFMEETHSIATKRDEAKRKLDAAELLFQRRASLGPVWANINQTGGLTNDPAVAKTQLGELLARWGKESNLEWKSERPDERRLNTAVDRKSNKPETNFEPIAVHATGAGSMAQITNLLWKLESAPKLIRVTEIHITPVVEAKDNLQIQLNVASLSLNPEPPPANPAANSHPVANANRGIEP